MIAEIGSRKEEIALLCRRLHVRRLHVRRLDVFGSASRGHDFDPLSSDVDFLVDFELNRQDDAFDAYFSLKEGLETLLNRPVDLVVEPALHNPFVRAEIERNRESVYGA
jgi:predicted nucleotidyltransferase